MVKRHCSRLHNCPQRCPHSNLWTLWIYYPSWQQNKSKQQQKKITDISKLRFLIQGDYPGLSLGPNVITKVLIKQRGKQDSQGDVIIEAEVKVMR